MTWLEALVLGLLQGLTEFLPVSSSGHIELGKALFDVQTTDNLLFSIVVHAATALSTVIIFRKDIGSLLTNTLRLKPDALQYAGKIIISVVPVIAVYFLLADHIEALFNKNILLVGCMLLVTALLLSFTYFVRHKEGKPVSYAQAFIIGVAQAIAVLPGISRSGATIATGLMLGVDKDSITRFSFLMVLIPIFGATLLEVKDYFENPNVVSGISSTALVTGFLAAFISGLIACQLMIRIVRRGKLIWFAVYCLVVGLIAIVVS